jgi:hypothetical protein
MNYRKFYLELISLLLSEAVTRKEERDRRIVSGSEEKWK